MIKDGETVCGHGQRFFECKICRNFHPVDEPYFIEVDDNGCSKCGGGRTWLVIGPDGFGGGESYGDEEAAADIADMLNDAFKRGLNSKGII